MKCCGASLLEYFLELFHQVWRNECVPQEWKDALIVPIPKKGDLSCCDNWRGISLLDVGGKLFTKVLQKRLQKIAEEVLPDSQCGFRSGRGCTYMVFCVRQLVKKAREHITQVFMLFIDLRKSYDSNPRQALWQVLRKYGVPPTIVSLLRSLHERMKAEVTMDGLVAPEFEVCNGLRQGCVITPALFNLYLNLVISQWREKCRDFGVDILYKCGGKLIGERTRSPCCTKMSEFLFADGAAAVGTSRSMERAASILKSVISEWILVLSIPKTKLMVAGPPCDEEEELRPLQLDECVIECVPDFKYLGSVVDGRGGIMKEVKERIAKASQAFRALKEPVSRDKNLSLATKRLVYKAVVLATLLYESEMWTTKRDAVRKLEVFHNRCLRGILGISAMQQRMEHISSVQVAKRCLMEESLEDMVITRRLCWLGHVAMMSEDRIPKKVLFGWLPQRRPAHGTKMRWRDRVRRDLRKFHIDENTQFKECQERAVWQWNCRDGLRETTKERLAEDEVRRSTRRNDAAAAATGQQSAADTIRPLTCDTCQRSFRRRQDIACHRCVTTRPWGQVLRPPT